MLTNKKLILAATVAAQCALASNLLWFEDDNEDANEDLSWQEDDADMTEEEKQEEHRRVLKAKDDPNKIGYFRGGNKNYSKVSKEDKMEVLWDQLVPNGDSTGVEPNPYWYAKFPEFFTQKTQVTFCNNSDEIKRNRNKTTHTQGLVAKVEWIPTQESLDIGYTGMMESGSDHIIMRLSETNNLDETTSPGLLPSVAFKFLRDNDMSYNVFAMPSFTPTGSWNFFEKPFLNVVEPFDKEKHEIERMTVLKKMTEGNGRPFGTAISDIARCNLDGSTVDEVKVPYRLSFQSPIDFSPDKEYEDLEDGTQRWVWWYEQLQRITEDSTIFEVFGWTAPEKLDGELIKIADIKLRSALHTSEFGDNRLFFRHQSIAKDRKFWPREWRKLREDPFINRKKEENIWGNEVPEDIWPEDEDEAKALYDAQVAEFGCPFQWLLADHDEDESEGADESEDEDDRL